MIQESRTLAVFQIESQGQLHLLAQHQPECFADLVSEVALFRPGPLQGGMVNPFIRRRRGQEPVQYDHPDLEPVLKDTYGIILFQEQILELAYHFAGMSMEEADEFRSLMSKFRDPGQMEAMRTRFVAGAVGRGVPERIAHAVFDKVANFVGYGFCKSHAAAFARTVYQSAWMKLYHPAAYMAAVMQHRPGMYNPMTLEEEARRCGVATLLPEINRSGLRYDLERDPAGRLAIRKPLTSVKEVSGEAARRILWQRLRAPFTSVEDLYRRVELSREALEGLAISGALDVLAGDSRRALWEIGVLANKLGPAGGDSHPTLVDLPALQPEDIPDLPALLPHERLSWDYRSHDAARVHPMTLARRALDALCVPSIETCFHMLRNPPRPPGSRGEPTPPGSSMPKA
ncbi:hypothetical protein HS125_08450 [bacterium]|nr:hypothetical protein [bacterium]